MSEKIVVNEIVLLTVIIDRKQKDALIALLSEAGGQLINTIYGKSLAKAGYLKEALGLVPENSRAVVVCLLPSEEAGPMLEKLQEKFALDKDQAGAGAAFTLSVERLSF
jgi:hypothetical protein